MGRQLPPREVAVKHVALFATPATVSSRAFQRELAFRAIGVDVEAQPCGGLVDAIEDGDEILAEALVRSHVEALTAMALKTPHLSETLKKRVGEALRRIQKRRR